MLREEGARIEKVHVGMQKWRRDAGPAANMEGWRGRTMRRRMDRYRTQFYCGD